MANKPLVTRSELRKRQEAAEKQTAAQKKQAEKNYKNEEKKIDNFYRKEKKKNRPVTKTRTGEREKQHRWNSFLIKSTIIVLLMLVAVFLAVAFI